MRNLTSWNNSFWLADGERFQRCIDAAIHKPCPTAEQIRARHREWMQLAKDLPDMAAQGYGITDAEEEERFILYGDPSKAQPMGIIDGKTGKQIRSANSPEAIAEANAIRAEAPRAIRAVKGKIGVIPIYGPVDQRMSGELEKAGGTPLDFVSAALDNLLGNQSVGAIVLRFDSPGGNVNGVQELADKIYEGRSVKPIYAIADSLAASAAAWLASAATMFVSTPAGGAATVGSIGVYVMHVDQSAAMEKEGVKVTMVSAGKYKTEFSPYGPLSAEAKAEAQARVDTIYDQFAAALRRNRDTTIDNVRQNYGQGRVLTAQQALSVGLIDRIMSYQELIDKLTGGGAQAMGGPSKAKLLALHEHEEAECA